MPTPVTSRSPSPSTTPIETPPQQTTTTVPGESGRTGRATSRDRNESVTGGLARRQASVEQQRRPLSSTTLPLGEPVMAAGTRGTASSSADVPQSVTPAMVEQARNSLLEAMERVPGEGKEMAFIKSFFAAPGASDKAKGKQADTTAFAGLREPETDIGEMLGTARTPVPLTIDSLLKTAKSSSDSLAIELTPPEKKAAEKGATQIQDFVTKGVSTVASTSGAQIGATENELAIERLSEQVIADASRMVGHNATPEERSAALTTTLMQRMSEAFASGKAFPARVAANDFESGTAKFAASVANVGARNALSVLIPTTARQMISYGIEKGMTDAHVSDHGRIALGTAVALLPVALHMVGAVRDHTAATETFTSVRSRAIMGGLTLAAVVAGLSTGVMRETAVQIIAFTIYTAMRDLIVQSRIKLENVNSSGTQPDATHFGLISVGYGVDQGLVNLAMSTKASPSGPTAFINKAGLNPGNAARRGGINFAGEVAEDLMFNGIPAYRESRPLQLALKDAKWTPNGVTNAALGPWAVRSGILGMSLIGSNIIAQHLGTPAHSAEELEGISDMFYALLNGVLYEPFANSGSAQPQPASAHDDAETASLRTIASHTYQSPDVVMTNHADVEAAEAAATPRQSNV
ncbi:hypothetical protein [Robbsia sp. KACC 23696]|uniref:hypothetical protein n=1 Tax=Robbsia sp. KACC 23696 TaxID=3149231 RepID=UPI00325B6619